MIFLTFSETLANVLTPQRAGKDTRLPSRRNENQSYSILETLRSPRQNRPERLIVFRGTIDFRFFALLSARDYQLDFL